MLDRIKSRANSIRPRAHVRWLLAGVWLLNLFPGPLKAETGDLIGVIRFFGEVSEASESPPSSSSDVCDTDDASAIQVEEHRLKNVVAYLEGIKEAPLKSAELDLVQKDCQILPHVAAVQRGTLLKISNLDKIFHSLRGRLGEREILFSIVQPPGDETRLVHRRRLMKEGIIHLSCSAGHPWASANIVVIESRYFAITDKKGHFSISAIPAGEYTLKLWHERLGEMTQLIRVRPKERTRLSLIFGDARPRGATGRPGHKGPNEADAPSQR